MKKPEKKKNRVFTKEIIDRARPQVVALAKLGCTDTEIGLVVDMGEESVKRHLRAELDEGRGHLRASLRKAQVETAIKDKNPTMLIWLGKCYLGQKEPKKELEHSGGLTVEKVVFSQKKK
jgi:hypothetical protein